METEFALGDLANAAARIQCGDMCGSGFQFLREDIILTSRHVIEPLQRDKAAVVVFTEDGSHCEAKLLAASTQDEHDFAILRTSCRLGPSRGVLMPSEVGDLATGAEVAFAGFPHGISRLLVHRAFVSGRYGNLGFYMDGTVNAGNSGGPVVDISDGNVVGIVTARRFVGAEDMSTVSNECARLEQYLDQVASGGQVQMRVGILGLDFAEFAKLLAQSFRITRRVIDANANSGIGVGFHIRFALEKCRELGLC